MAEYNTQRAPAVAALDALFAENLHATRTSLGVSRRELAEATGVSADAIETIEIGYRGDGRGGRRKVSIGEAVVLSKALGHKPGDFLKRDPGVSRG